MYIKRNLLNTFYSKVFILVLFSFFSCFENEIRTPSIYQAEILEFLNSTKADNSEENVVLIDQLESDLNFFRIEALPLANGQIVLIADTKNNTDKVHKILFFKSETTPIFKVNRISFSDSQSSNNYNNLLKSFLNRNTHSYSGKVEINNLYNNLLFFNKFDNGRLTAKGVVKSDAAKGSTGGKTQGCTAWYLITTNFYSDGSTETTQEYLGTTCNCEQNSTRSEGIKTCGGEAGSNGGAPTLPYTANEGDEFWLLSPNGTQRLMRWTCFDSGCSWVTIVTNLPEAVCEADRITYSFLPLNPFHGDVAYSIVDATFWVYDNFWNQWVGTLDKGIDCASFKFVKTTSDGFWQEAAVKNLSIKTVYYDPTTNRSRVMPYTITRAVWVGLPGYIPPGRAGEIAAAAESFAHWQISTYYKDKSFISQADVENRFVEFFSDALAGASGKADFHGSGSPLVQPTNATYVLVGNGDCY